MASIAIDQQMAHTYSEYVHDHLEISVVGRVREGLGYMRDLGFDDFSLRTLTEGYMIPFSVMPAGIYQPNNASARNHTSFVRQSIDALISVGAVEEMQFPPHVVNPLSVAIRGDVKRLVLDCQHINQYIKLSLITIEGPEVLVLGKVT